MSSIKEQITALQVAVQNYNTQVAAILAATGQGALDPSSIAAQIETATQEAIDEVLQKVEGLDLSVLFARTEVLSFLTSILNAYDPTNKFILEFFTDLYTIKDDLSISGVSTVAGDNSIDISDTSELQVGQEYIILGAEGAKEIITVDSILSADRFKSSDAVSTTITGGTLKRSTVSVANNIASFDSGNVYYSLPITLDITTVTNKGIVLRVDNPENLSFYFRNTGSQTWKEATWNWKRETDVTGYSDIEFSLPISNSFDIKIVATGPANVKHIVGMSKITGLEGVHHPPETPSLVYPLNNATGVVEQPSLTTSAYSHPATNSLLYGTEFQISTSSDFAELNIVDAPSVVPGISYAPARDVLSPNTSYYARARVVDIYGGISEWSETIVFTTATSFGTVYKPTATAPIAGVELTSPDSVTLVSSAFNTEGGVDTQANAQWQIANDPAFQAIVHDSGANAVNLTSYTVPDGTLERNKTYYWRVRHQGASDGWSDWSNRTVFSVANFSYFVANLKGPASEYFNDIAIDPNDNVYIVGKENSYGGGFNGLIAKYNIAGELQWQKNLGGSGEDSFEAVATDSSGNVYCVGYEASSDGSAIALLVKYNASGALQWQVNLGGAGNDYLLGIAIDASDNIYVAGYEASSNGTSNALVAKYNTSGNLIWQKNLGGAGDDVFENVTVDASGNVYCVGYEGSSSAKTNALIAQYNSSGVLQWQKSLGGSGDEFFHSVVADSAGYVYAVGSETSSDGTSNALIAKYNSSGVFQWQKSLKGLYSEAFKDISVDSQNNLFVTGYEASASGLSNALVARYDVSGILQWQKTLGGVGDDFFAGIDVDSFGNVFIAGYENSTTGTINTLLASINNLAEGASGAVPAITSMSWNDPALAVGNPSLSGATATLSDGNPSSTAGTPTLTAANTTLTEIKSEY